MQNVQKLLGPQLDKEREEERQRAAAQAEAEQQKLAEEQRKKAKDEAAARQAVVKPAEPAPPPPRVAVAPPPSVARTRTIAIVPLGIGLISGGVATWFLVSAKGKESALLTGTAPVGQAMMFRDSGKTDALLGYVFTGVAAAGLVTAGLLFALGGTPSPPPVTMLAAPGGVFVGISGKLPE